jgi:hypothetical protein
LLPADYSKFAPWSQFGLDETDFPKWKIRNFNAAWQRLSLAAGGHVV